MGGGSWSVAATIRSRPEYVADFTRSYLALGASELFIFFDDPAHGNATEKVDDARVISFVCDDGYWRSLGQTRPERLNDRQLANLRHARSRTNSGWLLNVDLDERVYTETGINEVLGGQPADVLSVSLPPAEALYDDLPTIETAFRTPWFKRVLAEREALATGVGAILFAMHGDLARLTRHGLFGHVKGKYFVRTGLPRVVLRLHAVAVSDGSKIVGATVPGLELLHFDSLTYEDWKEKWLLRISGAVSCNMSETRLGQFSLIEAAAKAQSEDGLRALYRSMYVPAGEALRAAVSAGVVVMRPPRAGELAAASSKAAQS